MRYPGASGVVHAQLQIMAQPATNHVIEDCNAVRDKMTDFTGPEPFGEVETQADYGSG